MIVIAIHTFGEYLDFHLHSHMLVVDGLFDRQSKFYVMRAGKDGGETRTKISPLELDIICGQEQRQQREYRISLK